MYRRALLVLPAIAAFAAFAADPVPVPPVPPEAAVARMKLPEGFRATLVAGEPTLVKPIAMTLDERGRIWVVESHTYPNWQPNPVAGHDRVLIFDEHDGAFGPPTVFLDKAVNLSGIAWGFGGIWLTAPPNLLFIPVAAGTDRPAGPLQVVLDGWDVTARHNVVNDLAWGPDGWLYGCNGILSNSRVGAPGTPDGRRTFLNCGVWRYHPTRKRFEAVASGTTNPWGIDFDDYGEIFITNCVIKHLFHIVPGGRYVRMFGEDVSPHSFGLMPSCADHIHWGGGKWTTSRGGQGEHDAPGGGHAHAGALVYLGDNWPDEYRNSVLMCNIHGNRLNRDTLERTGSGYVAHHGPDFLFANDTWFRGLALQAAADGGVFIDDWHDTGECHNYDAVRPCGRIFKVTYGTPRPPPVDLAGKSDDEAGPSAVAQERLAGAPRAAAAAGTCRREDSVGGRAAGSREDARGPGHGDQEVAGAVGASRDRRHGRSRPARVARRPRRSRPRLGGAAAGGGRRPVGGGLEAVHRSGRQGPGARGAAGAGVGAAATAAGEALAAGGGSGGARGRCGGREFAADDLVRRRAIGGGRPRPRRRPADKGPNPTGATEPCPPTGRHDRLTPGMPPAHGGGYDPATLETFVDNGAGGLS